METIIAMVRMVASILLENKFFIFIPPGKIFMQDKYNIFDFKKQSKLLKNKQKHKIF